jgi:hypothetical protein
MKLFSYFQRNRLPPPPPAAVENKSSDDIAELEDDGDSDDDDEQDGVEIKEGKKKTIPAPAPQPRDEMARTLQADVDTLKAQANEFYRAVRVELEKAILEVPQLILAEAKARESLQVLIETESKLTALKNKKLSLLRLKERYTVYCRCMCFLSCNSSFVFFFLLCVLNINSHLFIYNYFI